MATKTLLKFKNYIDVANNYKQNPKLYFFLKNFAFTKAYNALSKDYTGVSESDRAVFESMMADYKQEKAIAKPDSVMSKDDYYEFLEFFFSNINFDTCNLYIVEVCQDLNEVLGNFGDFDELATKRNNYFANKINMLSANNQSKVDTSNILTPFKSSLSSNNNSKSTTQSQPSKSCEDMTRKLPIVKNDSIEDMNITNMSYDYIPRFVDKTIELPISKNSPSYAKVKELIRTHMEYSGLELDFHKLDLAKDHIEAAIYYLRHIQQ